MAQTIMSGLEIYAMAGAALAAVFLTVGIGRVVPSARGAYVFRPLLVPGVILLWPYVAIRWALLERQKGIAPCPAAHRPPLRTQSAFALALCAVVPVVIVVALLIRQDGPLEAEAVQVAPPQAAPQSAPAQ